MEDVKFNSLLGKVLTGIAGNVGDDEMIFDCQDGTKFKMYHDQECCESVLIKDICGDLDDLIDVPILTAEESTQDKNPEDVTSGYQDSFTWTFYQLGTIKGSVTIRWYGESNGYYSEAVDFAKIV